MENISKYRTELMGISILWIMLYHSKIEIPAILMPLKFIKNIGYGGVDIFFLLSGLGLTFSISKDSSLVSFYWKRLIRILPTYWTVLFVGLLVAYGVKHEINFTAFMLSLSGFDFLVLGKLNTWFVPSIIVCYILFPGLYFLALKYGYKRALSASILLSLILSILLAGSPAKHLLIFTIRIPAFILGIYIAFVILNKEKTILSNGYLNAIVLFVAMAVLGFLLLKTDRSFRWNTGLSWYPTIVMSLPIAVLLGNGFEKIKKHGNYLFNPLKQLGLLSFEIYLVHTSIFGLASYFALNSYSQNFLRIPEYILYAVASFYIAKLLHHFLSKIDWDLIFNNFSQWATKRREKIGSSQA